MVVIGIVIIQGFVALPGCIAPHPLPPSLPPSLNLVFLEHSILCSSALVLEEMLAVGLTSSMDTSLPRSIDFSLPRSIGATLT